VADRDQERGREEVYSKSNCRAHRSCCPIGTEAGVGDEVRSVKAVIQTVFSMMLFAGVIYGTAAPSAHHEGCAVLLDVRVHPGGDASKAPVGVLLIDPAGRRTGIERNTHSVVQEIPDSSFEYEGLDDDTTGGTGSKSTVGSVCNPTSRQYSLWVVGMRQDSYDLEVHSTNGGRDPSDWHLLKVAIRKNTVHKYVIQFSDAGTSLVRAQR
jgi:hypothetical protein